MEIHISEYDGESGTGYENRLHHWFRHATWAVNEAILILCDVDPSTVEYFKNRPSNAIAVAFDFAGRPYEVFSYNSLTVLHTDVADLWSIWRSFDPNGEIERQSPETWMDWARGRRLRVRWMSWAVENHLVKDTAGATTITARESEGYSTAWMKVMHLTIAAFFVPRRNPDPKKDEVVDWIVEHAIEMGERDSRNIAEAIFTIIKPSNHDPRKRRPGKGAEP